MEDKEKLTIKALELIRAGELMTTREVAQKYGLTDRAVRIQVTRGVLKPDECVKISSGWLITRAGAERLWGNRE